MGLIPIFKGEVNSDGKLLLPVSRMNEWLKKLKGPVEVIVRRPKKPGSKEQRKYYWGIMMKVIADSEDCHPLEVHGFCKAMFLPYGHDSTETLSSGEREVYHRKVRVHFQLEFNIQVPLPNEAEY